MAGRSTIHLHELFVRNPAATFFLTASGDSIPGLGIHEGDRLVLGRSLESSHNRVVIAAVAGAMLVKSCSGKGCGLLKPANDGSPASGITGLVHVHIRGP